MNKICIGCPGCGKCQVCEKDHTTKVFSLTTYCSKSCFQKFNKPKNEDSSSSCNTGFSSSSSCNTGSSSGLLIDEEILKIGKHGSDLKQIAFKKMMEIISARILEAANNGKFKLTFAHPIPKELVSVLNLKQIQVSGDLKTLSW